MRKYIYGAAAILAVTCTTLLGLGAAGASTTLARPSATTACFTRCFDLSSLQLGTHMIQNKSNTKASKINLRVASNAFTNEDFIDDAVASVADFCTTTGTPGQEFNETGYICTHYASDPVYEADFAPASIESGNCVGVAVANAVGETVNLQPCGETVRTLWIADLADSTFHHGHLYTPWINGGDTNFSHPLVLSVNLSSKSPADGLVVTRLNASSGSSTPLTQEFTVETGPAS